MAVPAGVAAPFEVVQAEAVFEFAGFVLDAPADLYQPDELADRGRLINGTLDGDRRGQAEWRRKRLLDAALEGFVEKGVDRASVKDIARADGATPGLPLPLLEGKEALLATLRSWTVIRNYLYTTLPTLREWSSRHTSLRDVTEADARAAIQQTTGTTAQTQRTGLRSIFTALKQERVIFRDPTRSIVLGQVDNLPTGLRDDQLRGIIDRADGALQRLVVALVAIHAIGTEELRALTVDGVDTARGILEVPRRGRFHTVYLDEVTLRLMLDWRRQRRERWPSTTNPHLLITNHGAFALDTPPVSSAAIARIFHDLGLQARHVRSDRLLHEATLTQDPVHLMRVFGVSAATAMRYLHAAHPERGAVPPR